MSNNGIAGVKSAVAGVLAAVPGVSKVETKFGGVAVWVQKPRPGLSHWTVHVPRDREQPAGVGPQAYRFYRVEAHGYMPFSYSNPDSTAAWDALIEAVKTALRSHMSLGVAVVDTGLPQLERNTFEWVKPAGTQGGGENQPEVYAHACLIAVP